MQPVNKAERTKAFFNFLWLFILSIGIILTMVFFSVQVPTRQNEELLKQKHKAVKERKFADDFFTEMFGIAAMMDTINTSSKAELLDGDITTRINMLNARAKGDSAYDKGVFQNLVQNLYTLQNTQRQLRELSAKDQNVKDLQKENNDLTAQLEAQREKYNNLILSMGHKEPVK